ncbi:MAG: TetR/AcrR family transcriptional regulator [Tannerellaceae bacterium]|nr:TetR/AcrR family transcriptional regulator [Tannerellaceae bacterium]
MAKERIIVTAMDLFSQHGIKSVSMDDIARAMSISKRTLYEFFNDKETLLIEGMQYNKNRFNKILTRLEKSAPTAVDVILLCYMEMMKRPRWYHQRFYEDLKKYPKALQHKEEEKNEFIPKCKQLFARGVREGVFRDDVNFEIVALLAKDQAKMLHPSKTFSNHSNSEVYNTVLFTFLRGICTDEGRNILNRYAIKLSYDLK